jgi:hypothetical protein
MTLCTACLRDAPNVAFNAKGQSMPVCGMDCVAIINRMDGPMEDMNEAEIKAMYAASTQAGQYLETLGKTDMATFTEDEWLSMIDAAVTGFCDAMRKSVAESAPFTS